MPNEAPQSLDREQRLDEAVTAFLEAQEAGRQPHRQEWMDRYPELAADLEQFFADQDEVDRLTGPLRTALQGTPPPDDTPQPRQPGDTSSPISPSTLAAPPEGYDLLQVLGKGGMGLVYKARQKSAGRLVALKLIRAERLTSESDVQRFRNEAEAAAQLDHPHIVPVYEVGARQGHFFFSMKLIEGGGLDGQLDRFRADPPDVARLAVQVAGAVHHAHQRGILHRDLKPSNILLDREGRPHVCDFGLAKRIEADAGLTQTGAIIGTPQYMAPEQTSGRKGVVTTATDVYGLGAVLYALMTGRPPFQGETVLETLEQVREREPEPPRRLNDKVDRDLEIICLKCLQKEPQRRYESALALAEDLERWLNGEPIQARPISRWASIGRWCRRNPLLAVLSALSLFLLVLVVVGSLASAFWIDGQRKQAEQREAEVSQRERELRQHLYVQDIVVAWQAMREGELERMRGLLDRHIPKEGQEDLRGFEWYYLKRRSRGLLHEAAQVKAHEGDVYCVTYSPDGRILASAGKDGVIRFWDAHTLRPQGKLRGDQGEINEVAFAPDGKTLASAGDDGTVWLWDLASSQQRAILRPEGCWDELETVAISPDGKLLAAGGKDGGVWTWEFASGKLKATRNPSGGSIHYLTFAPDGRFLATASEDGQILLLDPATLQERGRFHPAGAVHWVAFSHDGKTLAAGSAGGVPILLWDLANQFQRINRPGHESSVIRSLSFSPDDTLLASCGEDGCVRLWDARSGSLRASAQGHSGRVWCMAFAPDGERLATAGGDGTVKLWHVLSGDRRSIQVVSETKNPVAVDWIVFSPDGQTLCTRTNTGEFGCWNTFSGQGAEPAEGPAAAITRPALPPGFGHENEVLALDVSLDGRLLATAMRDHTVRIWEPSSGRERCCLWKHRTPVSAVAFSPDGKMLASGAGEGEVILWNVAGGQELMRLDDHRGKIFALAFSPNGKVLAAGGHGTDNKSAEVTIWYGDGAQPEHEP